ncbi:hypothetical protein HPB49_019652 [Dermacentor silvarum]|uniref:Uncharacterized protein n=2 Tax=Dermacentor silvarum TaxID=543639 RepID=A0ACB8C552_DERSI|nr:hypothetical protein HPB49_019652 [Dermacentor silvarum]
MGAILDVPADPEPPPPPPPPPEPSPKPREVTQEKLYECVNGVLDSAARKRRRFLETVDLLVALQDYNFQKYRRVSGVVK